MAPKRRRDNDDENDEEQDKITWISDGLYRDLNNKRQSGRQNLNARLALVDLLPRPVRSVPRPRGEAGRKSGASNDGHRDGFTLKDILKRESTVDAKHYAMIQDTVHRLAARYLDIRCTWRENQGEELVTVCTEAAKLHPCLYDYDAFWPVHDHLKRHLLSMRDKYRYVDPDLVALHDAEAVAEGDVRPPPRKKRHTSNKNQQRSDSSSSSPSTLRGFAVDVPHNSTPPRQPRLQPYGHPQCEIRYDSCNEEDQQLVPQHPAKRLAILMDNWHMDNRKFLPTLLDDLISEGHPVRYDLALRLQVWKILLGVKQCDPVGYDRYISRGPSTQDNEIRSHVSRYQKFGVYAAFLDFVRDSALIRLVNAFVWRWEETKHHNIDTDGVCDYALVLMYTMPSEAEAFWCLCNFVEKCPTFVELGQPGCDRSQELLDECLEYLDKELHTYLRLNDYSVDDYAFTCTRDFSAIMGRSADQVLALWDLLLSHGLHLNVLTLASRMLVARDSIMGGEGPEDILLGSSTLNAELVIHCTLELERQLPSTLLNELKRSLVDFSLYSL